MADEPQQKKPRIDATVPELAAEQPAGASERTAAQPTDASSKPNKGGKGKGKGKQQTPEFLLGMEVVAALKSGQVEPVISCFERSLEASMKLPLQTYNSMLFMLTGQECWDHYIGSTGLGTRIPKQVHNLGQPNTQQKPSKGSDMSEDLKLRAAATADKVLARMEEVGVKPDEVAYTAMARLAAIRGDYDKAYQKAEECAELTQHLKLRMFLPALIGYADTGNVEAALKLDARLMAGGVDLTETEYALLLEAVGKAGSYEQMAGLLLRISKDLNQLSTETLDIIRGFFQRSEAAQAQFAAGAELEGRGAGRWQVLQTTVNQDGFCADAGGQLQVVDLEEDEWAAFGDSIAELACKKEQGEGFKRYTEWYARNGPYDILLDAANIAYYGQNRDGGGFNWRQIGAMVEKVKAAHPGKKMLVMLHIRRTKDEAAQTPEAQAIMKQLQASKSFYYTPRGSNDDWYWMYAAVRSGRSAMLISNDELRDHIFQLLRPKHFLKWKERHIIHYNFDPYLNLSLIYPPKYTPCVQRLANGSWVFPSVDGSWLCARPAPAPPASS